MKVGLSFSRCIKDLVEGKVTLDDILVVITRTDFNPKDDFQWSGIWRGYCEGSMYNMNQEWYGYDYKNPEHEKMFRDATVQLYDAGKFHQPRQFGANPIRLPYHWLETVLTDEDLENRPAAKIAWDRFKTVAGLGGYEVKTGTEW